MLLHRIEKEAEWRVLRNDFFPEQIAVVDPVTFETNTAIASPQVQCVPRKKPTHPVVLATQAFSTPTSVSDEEDSLPTTVLPSLRGEEATTSLPPEKYDLVFFTTVELFGKTVSENRRASRIEAAAAHNEHVAYV